MKTFGYELTDELLSDLIHRIWGNQKILGKF